MNQEWESMCRDAARQAADALGLDETPELELEQYEIRVELDTPLRDLFAAINQAVSDLENQGEKSNRIAEQLLAAKAKFCRETGCL